MRNKMYKMFEIAMKENFAIPSVNFVDREMIRAYAEVVNETKLPIIFSIAESHLIYIDLKEAFLLAEYYIKKYNLNAVIHLDHGQSTEVINEAMELGFDSIMIDGSGLPFEENVKITKKVVEFAHSKNIFVESEIGHVGSGKLTGIACSVDDDTVYTSKEEAVKFAKLTSTDSLAISIGTVHGSYKGEPKINFERLQEIRKELSIPLVLHGGSSSGDENLNKCAKNGINKINIYTDFIIAAQNANDSKMGYFDNKNVMKEAIKNKLRHYFKVFDTKEVK